MGMLVDGVWRDNEQKRTSSSGAFERTQSTFRHTVAADSDFAPEANRYHLFVNAGCPWAYRTILYRSLKQLNDVISMSFTQPAAGPQGWTFGTPEDLLGARHMHEIYSQADDHFTGRATVPVLWDTQTRRMVNNESADIIRMFNHAFDALAEVNPVDYYPKECRDQIDAWNERIYTDVNNGVYRCGFAQSQSAYDEAFDQLFAMLDELDAHLSSQRYLCGNQPTEADWRLFSTLVRFDTAYYSAFRCNRTMLKDFAHLWPYTRDLYQQPHVAETVDFAAIKSIYFGSRPPGIIPGGPALDFAAPHQRG